MVGLGISIIIKVPLLQLDVSIMIVIINTVGLLTLTSSFNLSRDAQSIYCKYVFRTRPSHERQPCNEWPGPVGAYAIQNSLECGPGGPGEPTAPG